jgi:hypothetical protein
MEVVSLADGTGFYSKWHDAQPILVPKWNEGTFSKELDKRCGRRESLKVHKLIQT